MRLGLAGARKADPNPLRLRLMKIFAACSALAFVLMQRVPAMAGQESTGGEANLKLPTFRAIGVDGHKLLLFGIIFCVAGTGRSA